MQLNLFWEFLKQKLGKSKLAGKECGNFTIFSGISSGPSLVTLHPIKVKQKVIRTQAAIRTKGRSPRHCYGADNKQARFRLQQEKVHGCDDAEAKKEILPTVPDFQR